MATKTEQVQAFAQSVYLAKNNRYFDDITSDDGVEFVNQTMDWANQFAEELELETDWNYLRQTGYSLGTVSTATQTIEMPSDVRKLVVDEYRPLQILQDGTSVSDWDVVPPSLITDPNNLSTRNRVTVVNNTIVFSRSLNENELGGIISADVIGFMPKLSLTDISLLTTIKPKQLLILGVAKNSTLPDIVQGGLSPSLVQKYNDLLDKAIAENDATAAAATAPRDDYGYIGGIGF
jgi:hypothetical protein